MRGGREIGIFTGEETDAAQRDFTRCEYTHERCRWMNEKLKRDFKGAKMRVHLARPNFSLGFNIRLLKHTHRSLA
jgi:hypothetical protein